MDLAEFKSTQRRIWSAGDYRQVGRTLVSAAERLVAAAGVSAGDRVLDVGTGSGSVAVFAAREGASVVGIDITDTCFDEAHRRAEEAGVTIDLELGDAEDLRFPDASFDLVLSSFAVIFAPRHDVAAAELARVCRPGGTIAITAWPQEGASSSMFAPLMARLPPPPEFVMSSRLWGDAEYVRRRFATHGVEFTFETPSITVEADSAAALEDHLFTNSGPFIAARTALEEMGVWPEVRLELRAAIAAANLADGDSYRTTWDYLLAMGRKQGHAPVTG